MKSLTTFFKNLTLGKKILLAFTPIISMIITLKAALIGLFLLLLLDLLTGIKKNLNNKGISFNPTKVIFWKSIKSYLLRQTWRKAYEYLIGILAVIVLESMVFGAGLAIPFFGFTFSLSEIAILVSSSVELWSIFENLSSTGFDLHKRVLHLLPEKLQQIFIKPVQ